MRSARSRVIHVEIHGQRYPDPSSLDPPYVTELAAYVDEKMRLAAPGMPGGGHAEGRGPRGAEYRRRYLRSCDDVRRRHDSLDHRAGELERMLDLALGIARTPCRRLRAASPETPDCSTAAAAD